MTLRSATPPKEAKPTSIRLEPDLLDWLADDAAANSRTVAGSIRHYLRQAREQAA